MASYTTIIVLSIFLWSFFNQTLGKQLKNPNSLVLGLVHATTSPITPKSLLLRKKSSEMVDIMEPLRESRDGYLIPLNLGTPPQVIQVFFDTGSDLIWVPCGNLSFDCINCDGYEKSKPSTTFSPTYSSTSIRDTCPSNFCVNIHSSDNYFDPCTIAGCSLNTLFKGTCLRPCPSFAYTYGGNGIVIGTLIRDIFRVYGTSNSKIRVLPNFCFGCVGYTYNEPIGIGGFGRGALSLISQLGFIEKGFSHCFLPFKFANNPNFSSPLVLGNLAISSKDHLQFTPFLKSLVYPNYYYVGLEAITIDNNTSIQASLSLNEFDSHGNGGFLIDSGTTYTHLPEPLYSNLLSALELKILYPRAEETEGRTGFDLCYVMPFKIKTKSIDDSNLELPSITFHFLNDVSLVLPRENYFYAMAAPINSTVVKCFLFQAMDNEEYGPAGVFGSFQQQNMEVVYDLEKERLGFQPMDCSSSSASHQISS